MDLLTEWVKPGGVRLSLNNAEATVEHAKNAGWKRYDETPEGLAEAEEILMARELRAESAVERAQAAQKEAEKEVKVKK